MIFGIRWYRALWAAFLVCSVGHFFFRNMHHFQGVELLMFVALALLGAISMLPDEWWRR